MARAIDSEVAYRFLSEQLVKETGAFSKGVNKGLNIARSAMRNPDAIPTLTQPNEPLTLGLVDKYGAPLYAGDTVAADKFFMYAIRYGSHNVNPKQCEPAYQVGWYLEIVWALYNEDKTYIGHTEALYDIGGVAARYPAHCADTTEGVQNLLLYKHRPPEVSP